MKGVEPCACRSFRLWYTEKTWDVCECGHPRLDHLDSRLSCLGNVHVDRDPEQMQVLRGTP